MFCHNDTPTPKTLNTNMTICQAFLCYTMTKSSVLPLDSSPSPRLAALLFYRIERLQPGPVYTSPQKAAGVFSPSLSQQQQIKQGLPEEKGLKISWLSVADSAAGVAEQHQFSFSQWRSRRRSGTLYCRASQWERRSACTRIGHEKIPTSSEPHLSYLYTRDKSTRFIKNMRKSRTAR